jgi:predicted nucleic acid-binding protein
MPTSPKYPDLLFDTNSLIYLANESDKYHSVTRSAFERLLRAQVRPWMTPQNIVEFWAVSTKGYDANGIGLSIGQVELQLRLLETRIRLLPDSMMVHARWREIVQQRAVHGHQVYDAKLVAAMEVHGIPAILTKNVRDFAQHGSVEAIDPANVGVLGI